MKFNNQGRCQFASTGSWRSPIISLELSLPRETPEKFLSSCPVLQPAQVRNFNRRILQGDIPSGFPNTTFIFTQHQQDPMLFFPNLLTELAQQSICLSRTKNLTQVLLILLGLTTCKLSFSLSAPLCGGHYQV